MGRIHGRNGVLYLRDKDGNVHRYPVSDWTISSSVMGSLGPLIEVREAQNDPEEGE